MNYELHAGLSPEKGLGIAFAWDYLDFALLIDDNGSYKIRKITGP